MKLYNYYRSTPSYRVRIVLNIKQIEYENISVHLLNNGGEHHRPEYLKINPQGLVPTLDDQGHFITQSLAIIDYLEDLHPTPALLPSDPFAKAEVRSLALLIACDIHPLNNLRVLNQLRSQFNADEAQVQVWVQGWIKEGLNAFEQRLQKLNNSHPLCYGNQVTLADVCLIPQLYSAQRFGVKIEDYPLISQINQFCLSLPAFQQAEPKEP